jgi:outer membrane protein TolC
VFLAHAASVGGCHAPPRVGAVEEIARATGASQAIRFDVTGGSTDVDATRPAGLPLADAVQEALSRDPRVQAALARVHVTLAESKQTRLLPNPVLSVALRFPEGGGKLQIDAGLSADLIALLRRPREISAADKRLHAVAAEAVVVALDVVAEVEETYAEAQSLEAQLDVLDQQVKLNERLLQLAKDRLEAGESARLDVLTLDAKRVELETDAIQRRADLTDKRLVLARLIGRPSRDAGWALDSLTTAGRWSGDERAWVQTGLERRPEIQARQWELAALGDEVALAQLAAFDDTEVGVDAERDDKWSVGPAVSAPITIFDWGQSRRAKAEAQRIEARHRATEARRQVVEDVRRGVARLVAAQTALNKVETQLLPLQQRRHEQAEQAYREGLADVTALLVAEQDLLASRAKVVEVRRDAAFALIRLHRAVGGSGAAHSLAPSPTTRSTNPTASDR